MTVPAPTALLPWFRKAMSGEDYLIDKMRDADTGGEEERVFESFLRERGLKFTKARKILLRKVFEMHDHFTAEQLLDRLKQDGVAASKATVYRTLSVLLECDLLVAHDFGEGALYYEHTFGHDHHDHLFCLSCKRITEFRDDRIEEHQERVTGDLGFQMLSHSLKIYGICKACGEKDPALAERYAATPGLVRHRS